MVERGSAALVILACGRHSDVTKCNIISDPIPMRRPVRWEQLRTDEAEKLIREWSREEGRVIFRITRLRDRMKGPPWS